MKSCRKTASSVKNSRSRMKFWRTLRFTGWAEEEPAIGAQEVTRETGGKPGKCGSWGEADAILQWAEEERWGNGDCWVSSCKIYGYPGKKRRDSTVGLRRYSEIQMQGLAFSDRNGGREYGYKGRRGTELEEKGWRNVFIMGVGIGNQQSLPHREKRLLYALLDYVYPLSFIH